jgi:hypothetical protein
MRKSHNFKIFVLGALCCAFSTACGGGGGMSQSVTTATAVPTNPDSFDIGVAGTVAAPSAATFGSSPPQLATPGGPTFDGGSGSYPSNVTFPLLINGLQKTSTGLSPAPTDPGAAVTVVSSTCCSSTVQIMIPSAGVNVTETLHSSLAGGLGEYIDGLSYVVFGA